MKVLLACVVLGWSMHSVQPPGPLAPPGPPALTMKSLQQGGARIDVLTLSSDGIASRAITDLGSYYLSDNMVGAASLNGLNIRPGNVRLDLNGFTLTGVANRFAIMSSAAIVADNTVVDSEGIQVGHSSQILRNTVRSSTGSGIRLAGSNNPVIRNFASGNGSGNYGFIGSGIYRPLLFSPA